MRRLSTRLFFLLVLTPLVAVCLAQQAPTSPSDDKWTLTWSDEFNGPDGSGPDPAKWVFDVGGSGWGNQELEYYTRRRKNARIEDGNLVITVLQEKYTGPHGVTRNYTSARLKTLGKFTQTYGRFEARIKIPYGQGLWPAFWMLGDDIKIVGGPGAGEIDIMENIGKKPATVYATIHGPGFYGAEGLETPYSLPAGRFADEFHVFAVEWEPDVIRFSVDGDVYATHHRADLKAGQQWVFGHPFLILLNVAVGGEWPGNPDESTVFPQKMLVDYVRVYQKAQEKDK